MSEAMGIIMLEVIAVLAALTIYAKMPPKDKAALWRKTSCRAGAIAVGIETTEAKYAEYKSEMGLA